MKKKIIALFVCILVAVLPLSVLSSSYELDDCALASDFTEEDNCGCESTPVTDPGFLDNSITIDDTAIQSGKPAIQNDLPPYFSWRDTNGVDWTTSAKDQGSCGSCWAFAALGALESIIQIREGCAGLNLDLSEQYILSCLRAAGSCNGGWAYNAYRYIKLNTSSGNYHNGILPEQYFPYQVSDKIPCANVSAGWQDFLIPISDFGRWVPDGSIASRNAMKTQLMESGPLVATMLFTIHRHGPNNLQEWGYTHHDPTDYYPYPGPLQGTNHQVVIVGWKDDPAITNGGYWIVKNSLGEEWGYDGFFNIEYGSLNIDRTDINWVDYDPMNYSNWIPVAKINAPSQAQPNQELVFNGTGSFDHEGSIVSYHWDFGDGTTATEAVGTYTYTSRGIYLVRLTVTDNASNTDTTSMWVYVDKQNQAPRKPWLLGRRTGQNGTTYRYTFWSIDPDGDDVEYYLNWGDDYWFGGAAGWIGPFRSGEKITLEKTWKEKGNYTVRLKAKDQYGAKSDWATLSVTMPCSYETSFLQFWVRLLERFPNAFPLLRYIIGY